MQINLVIESIQIPLAQKYYFEENLNSKYLQNNPHVEKSEQKPNSMSQYVCDDFYVLTILNEI